MKNTFFLTTGLILGLQGAWTPSAAENSRELFLRPAQPSSPPLSSSSRRFVIRGFSPQDAGTLAVWCETMTSKLESRLGHAVPFNRSEMVQVVGFNGGDGAPSQIRFSQEFFGLALQQRMTVENPELVTGEMLTEALVRIHMNRFIVSMRRRLGPGNVDMTLPDWFAVGIAQCLPRELQERNESFVRDSWVAGEVKSVSTLVKLHTLSQLWGPDKAWCGVFMNWQLKNINDTIGWNGVIRHIASGGEMTLDWVGSVLLGEENSGSVEKRWDLHLARLSEVQVDLGSLDQSSIAALKKILQIYPRDMIENPGDVVPLRLGPADLPEYAGELWLFSVCNRKIGELTMLAAGKAPEFVAVSNGYVDYLRLVGASAGGGAISGGKLREMDRALETADLALARLEESMAARIEYVSEVKSGLSGTNDTRPEPGSAMGGKDAARQSFLDRVEKQFSPQ